MAKDKWQLGARRLTRTVRLWLRPTAALGDFARIGPLRYFIPMQSLWPSRLSQIGPQVQGTLF